MTIEQLTKEMKATHSHDLDDLAKEIMGMAGGKRDVFKAIIAALTKFEAPLIEQCIFFQRQHLYFKEAFSRQRDRENAKDQAMKILAGDLMILQAEVKRLKHASKRKK